MWFNGIYLDLRDWKLELKGLNVGFNGLSWDLMRLKFGKWSVTPIVAELAYFLYW